MKTLLLLAHGSRRQAANEEIIQLAQRLQRYDNAPFNRVEAAFLEMAEPSIPQAIDAVIKQGATQVWLMPYFLVAGRHVAEDIPAIIRERQNAHPNVSLQLCAYLGASELMVQWLTQSIENACQVCSQKTVCQYPHCVLTDGTAPENR